MSALPDVTERTFQTDVLASPQPVLVDFWAPWCGPCRMLAPTVEKIAAANATTMKFYKLNTDENPDIAGKYHITGIPCLLVFKDGHEVDRMVGVQSERAIASILEKHLVA